MNRKQCLITAVVLLAWMTTGPGWGVTGTATHTLQLIHRQNIFQSDNPPPPETYKLKSTMAFEIEPTEEVRIVVKDPNPFLFTYTLEGIVKQNTQDFEQASQFVGQLNNLAGVLKGMPGTAPSALAAPSGGARAQILGAEASNTLDTILSRNGIDKDFFKQLGDDIGNLSNHVQTIPDLIASSAGDERAVQKVKDDVHDWKLSILAARIRNELKKVDDVESELLKAIGPLSSETAAVDFRLYGLFIVQDQSGKILASLGKAEDFAKTVDTIDVPMEIATIPFSATQDAIATITIKVVEANAKVAEKTGRFHDTMKITFSPLSPVHFGFGGALVYSFVKKSEFKAQTVNGQIKIVETKGANYTGQNVAAVLTITPRAWDNPIFGGQFQIGFNPKKDELAFYLGAGFKIFTLARIGVGVTYQEVPKLASGLQSGQIINSTSDLKLDTEFKAGGYIFISVTTK